MNARMQRSTPLTRATAMVLALLIALAGPLARPEAAATAQEPAPHDRIIVSGASGQLGRLVVKALLARGVPAANLILVSRTPETLQEYAKLGASTRFGDLSKPESLAAAYAGGTRMLLISIDFSAGPRPQAHKRAIDAAIADGVQQIAYTSFVAISAGDSSGIGADHLQTERILKSSGVHWTILRNSIYQDMLVDRAAQMLAAGHAVVSAKEVKIGYVTRADCAAAAAAVLTTPGHDNKAYDITGSQLIGTREIAAAATAVTGRPISLTEGDSSTALPGLIPSPALTRVSTAVAQLTGKPPTTLRELFEANRSTLVGAGPADPVKVADVLKRFNVQEAAAPVRERKDWRAPKKMVVLGSIVPPGLERDTLASILPGVKIVYARDVAAAAIEARDADIIAGLTAAPGICEPAIIENARQLRWILAISAGVEQCIAEPSVRARDILVTNQRGIDSAAIGEHAIALTLAMAHGIDTFVIDQAQGRWSRQDAIATHLQTLKDKTLLVVGLGGIGTEVASRAHALGMKVIATRASGREGPDYVSYVGTPDELLKLAPSADVIVNAAPLTAQTTGIYDAKFFSTMKPTAYFVNVARGGSVVTADLVAALNEGKIAGAGLDVADPEPLPPDHPLWHAANVIITPHISSSSDIPNEARWIVLNEDVRRYAAGEKMLSVVDLKREY